MLTLLYEKRNCRFKGIISTDNADKATYRTIILQRTEAKRLTGSNFFSKKFKIPSGTGVFLLLEKEGVDENGDYIIKGMSSGGNSEPAKGKENRKINAGDYPEKKLRYAESVPRI